MKTIVITGASRGIGLAIAQKFLEHDWRVIGTSRNGEILIQSPNLISILLELSLKESRENAVSKILQSVSAIDVLVNNAAVLLDMMDVDICLEKLRETFEVNVFGTIDFTEQLLSRISTGGHIVNIDSQMGAISEELSDADAPSYHMAKASLNMYTKTLAFRLKEKNIIVSSLDPGWVDTDMGRSAGVTETSRPDRKPEDVALDIYRLVANKVESGCFWRFGKKRSW